MDGEEGGGIRLSKRFSDKGGEVDFKTKSGTAWSHSYLNQKPWHPLSYPNQRRKWIAEQIQNQHQRRTEEVSREARLSLHQKTHNFFVLFKIVLFVISILYDFFSMRKSRSFFARQLSSPRKRRKRLQSLLFFFAYLTFDLN